MVKRSERRKVSERRRSKKTRSRSRSNQKQRGGYCIPIQTVKEIVQKEYGSLEDLEFDDVMQNGSEFSRFEVPLNPACLTYNELFALIEHYSYIMEPMVSQYELEDHLTQRLQKYGIHDPHNPVVLAGRIQNLKDSRRLALPADLKALTASYLTGKKGSLNSQYNQLMQNRGVTLAPRMGGYLARARSKTRRQRR